MPKNWQIIGVPTTFPLKNKNGFKSLNSFIQSRIWPSIFREGNTLDSVEDVAWFVQYDDVIASGNTVNTHCDIINFRVQPGQLLYIDAVEWRVWLPGLNSVDHRVKDGLTSVFSLIKDAMSILWMHNLTFHTRPLSRSGNSNSESWNLSGHLPSISWPWSRLAAADRGRVTVDR